MGDCSRKVVLLLYKRLIKYGQELKLTDQKYFYNRVRQEFEEHRLVKDQASIARLIQKGETFLALRRLV